MSKVTVVRQGYVVIYNLGRYLIDESYLTSCISDELFLKIHLSFVENTTQRNLYFLYFYRIRNVGNRNGVNVSSRQGIVYELNVLPTCIVNYR